MALDPKKLKVGELVQLLNSTPLGTVASDRQVRLHRQAAGFRISDGKTVDLLRYVGWLMERRHGVAASAASGLSTYDRMKESAAARNRDESRKGRDIGELPLVANPERRAHAAQDLEYFLKTYQPLTFTLPWSEDHKTVLAKTRKAILEGDLFAEAMPRGSGKTSIVEGSTIWAVINGYQPFIVPIGSTEEAAAEMLESIKTELSTNELLAADYPEVCIPIIKLEGIANRCSGQLYNGERTHIEWADKTIVLPTIKLPDTDAWRPWRRADGYSLASGAIVKVAGITGRIRGMKHKCADGRTIRPSFVIPDDPQTDESARSLSQCQTRERLLAGAILGLAGPGKKIAGIMPCTVIRAGDMADNILDRDKHPEWNGERMKMVYAFPTNTKWWERYADIRAESLRIHGDIREATALYEASRAVADAGAKVAWQERFNTDEGSAIQHAMNLKLRDEAAFFAEYQNEPLPEKGLEDEGILTADQIAQKLNGHEQCELPLDTEGLTMFIDVQGKLLFYLVLGHGPGFNGYIVDYGSYPDQRRRYFTLRDASKTLQSMAPKAGLEGAIYAGLEALTGQLLGREWIREDGARLRIGLCMPDANWGTSTEVVYRFCRQSAHAAVLLPSHGRYVGASSIPFSEYRKKRGDQVGMNWRIPSVHGQRAIRHVVFDANYWKSFIHARLAVSMGDSGAFSLYGRDPEDHRLIAEHLTAEYRVRVEARGRVVDEWKQKLDASENHWLDCLVGATVAASIRGAAIKEMAGDMVRSQRAVYTRADLRRRS